MDVAHGIKPPVGIAAVVVALGITASVRSVAAVTPSTVPTVAIGPVQGVAVAEGTSTTVVYVATHAGLYRSASPTYALWTKRNAIPSIDELSPNPRTPDSLLYSGTGGIYRSTDGGRSGALVSDCPHPVFARSPSSPNVVYATSASPTFVNGACGGTDGRPTIVKSTDDGLTWTTVMSSQVSGTSSSEGYVDLVVDPNDPAHAIVGYNGFKGYGSVSATTNGGQAWPLIENAPYAFWSPTALAINPGDSDEVWVAWSGVTGPGGALRRSIDGGQH